MMRAQDLPGFLRLNRSYLRWRLRNPTRSYADFYVHSVTRRLDAKIPHVTLGQQHSDSARFERTGAAILQLLQREGLKPHHSVVDYGCGSLRVGHHLIRFLDPGRYRGLDVTDRFLRDGLTELDPELIREKAPRFSLISRYSLEREAKSPPDFIVSTAVLLHVPRSALPGFLRNLLRLTGPHTQGYLHVREGPRYTQVGKMTWVYPAQMLIRHIERLGGHAKLLPSPSSPNDPANTPEARFTPRYLNVTR